jgi:nucleoside-diphosphate-sugar epimerase
MWSHGRTTILPDYRGSRFPGHQPRALSAGSAGTKSPHWISLPFDYPERPQITEITGDIRDRKAKVDEAMQGIDIVVHTAAALPLYKKEDIFSTDIDGTRNVIDSAHQHGVKRLFTSPRRRCTACPIIIRSKRMISLSVWARMASPRSKPKRSAWNIAIRACACPLIRPKSFIGLERLGVFALLYDWAKDGKNFPIPGKGNNLYQYLDVEDLCDAIYLCATLDDEVANDTFNIGAKEFGTFREDFQAVLDHAGHGKRVISVPGHAPAVWVLRILDRLKLSPLYPWVYETAIKDSLCPLRRPSRSWAGKPKYSNKDALIRNYDWYVANLRQLREAESGVTHRVPWSQGVLKLAKVFF